MDHHTIPVILTGTLERNPEAFLTPERSLQCILTVRTAKIRFVRAAATATVAEPRYSVYTVRVASLLRNILFECADKGCRVTVPGLLDPCRPDITAAVVYNAVC
jgi:hypothetical protein